MIKELAAKTSIKKACDSLGIPRSSYYYWQKTKPIKKDKVEKRKKPDFAYSESERNHILSVMNSEKYMDFTPYEIYNSELDAGKYHCSIRTMYRILQSHKQFSERRKINRNNYQKPELLANKPNQVWTWDITKLKGPKKWTYFYLYVIIDIYSRYVVGWVAAYRERSQLAKEFLRTTLKRQNIKPGELIIHADRGSSMCSKPVAFLLSDLGVTKTHSRPYVSNDNPFSESQFKTMKYNSHFPDRFFSMIEVRTFCRKFFHWYNNEHYHSGINFLTPESVHYENADKILEKRNIVLKNAFKKNPKRFRAKKPKVKKLPNSVWINKPKNIENDEEKNL